MCVVKRSLAGVAVLACLLLSSCTPGPSGTGGTTTTTTPGSHAPFSRPLVSIEFDDGWSSAYRNGLPVAKEFGFTPTEYIITDTAAHNDEYGTGTYMTPAQILDWVAQGGDIGDHTVTHPDLTALSPAAAQAEMSTSKAYLTTLLGRAPTLFATPYCASNATVDALASLQFEDLRNCDGPTNTAATWNRYDVHSLSVEDTTSVADIRSILATTRATNGWTVLTWHEIGTPIDPADPTYTTSVSQFRAELQAIADSGITVVSSQQALDEERG